MTRAIHTTGFALMALLITTAAVQAEITREAVTDSLTAAGYTPTEIHYSGSTVHAEATNGTNRIEVVYDRATGQVVSQEVSGRDAEGAQSGTDDTTDDDATDDHGAGDDDGPDHDAGDDHGGSDSDGGSDHDGGDHGGGSDD